MVQPIQSLHRAVHLVIHICTYCVSCKLSKTKTAHFSHRNRLEDQINGTNKCHVTDQCLMLSFMIMAGQVCGIR